MSEPTSMRPLDMDYSGHVEYNSPEQATATIRIEVTDGCGPFIYEVIWQDGHTSTVETAERDATFTHTYDRTAMRSPAVPEVRVRQPLRQSA